MIYEYWLPIALRVGITYKDFWRMTPRKMEPLIGVCRVLNQEEAEKQDRAAWLTGVYVTQALYTVLDSSNTYPEEPFIYHYYEKENSSGSEESNRRNGSGDEENVIPVEVTRFEAFAKVFNKEHMNTN